MQCFFEVSKPNQRLSLVGPEPVGSGLFVVSTTGR